MIRVFCEGSTLLVLIFGIGAIVDRRDLAAWLRGFGRAIR